MHDFDHIPQRASEVKAPRTRRWWSWCAVAMLFLLAAVAVAGTGMPPDFFLWLLLGALFLWVAVCCFRRTEQRLAFREGEVRSVHAPADVDHDEGVKLAIGRLQLQDHLSGRGVACAECRSVRLLHMLFRCRFCGVWYCMDCSRRHFERREGGRHE